MNNSRLFAITAWINHIVIRHLSASFIEDLTLKVIHEFKAN